MTRCANTGNYRRGEIRTPIDLYGGNLNMRGNAITNCASIDVDAITLTDNETLTFGTGSDATIQYDGTDMLINPRAVGSGDLELTAGDFRVNDSQNIVLGTGEDVTIQYDGTDLKVNPQAVGSGNLDIVAGNVTFIDNAGVTLGTGDDATIRYDGTDLKINPQVAGSGNVDIVAGNITLIDTSAILLGTGDDASISYNGTDLIINPQLVGSGKTTFEAGILNAGRTVLDVTWTDAAGSNTATLQVGADITGVEGATYHAQMGVDSGASMTVANNASVLATLGLSEPDISVVSGTVTTAATLYVASAPTEGGTNNNAVRVVAGSTYLGGNIEIPDSILLQLGTGQDATLQYDGTDLKVNPQAVGSGNVDIVAGNVTFIDNAGVTLGTGDDATIRYDGTDLKVNPRAVGSGNVDITAGNVTFVDNAGVTLGTGDDSTIQYDGTNLRINPRAVGSGNLVVSSGDGAMDVFRYFTVVNGTAASKIGIASGLTPTTAAEIGSIDFGADVGGLSYYTARLVAKSDSNWSTAGNGDSISGSLDFQTFPTTSGLVGDDSATPTSRMTINNAGRVRVETTTDSTSSSTGSLVILGGVGIAKEVYMAEDIHFLDNKGCFFGTGEDATLQYDGTNLIVNPRAAGAGDFRVSTSGSVLGFNVVGGTTANARLSATGGQTMGLISGSASSGISTSAAFNLWSNSDNDLTAPSGTLTSISTGGDLTINGTTDSTSGTTGSIQTDGGIGSAKNIISSTIVCGKFLGSTRAITAVPADDALALVAADMTALILNATGALSTDRSKATRTAAQIVADFGNPLVNSSYDWYISPDTVDALTITAGTDVTLTNVGSTTNFIFTGGAATSHLIINFTNVTGASESVTIYRLD